MKNLFFIILFAFLLFVCSCSTTALRKGDSLEKRVEKIESQISDLQQKIEAMEKVRTIPVN